MKGDCISGRRVSHLAHIRGRHNGVQDWRKVLGQEGGCLQDSVREDRQERYLGRQPGGLTHTSLTDGVLYAGCQIKFEDVMVCLCQP